MSTQIHEQRSFVLIGGEKNNQRVEVSAMIDHGDHSIEYYATLPVQIQIPNQIEPQIVNVTVKVHAVKIDTSYPRFESPAQWYHECGWHAAENIKDAAVVIFNTEAITPIVTAEIKRIQDLQREQSRKIVTTASMPANPKIKNIRGN